MKGLVAWLNYQDPNTGIKLVTHQQLYGGQAVVIFKKDILHMNRREGGSPGAGQNKPGNATNGKWCGSNSHQGSCVNHSNYR